MTPKQDPAELARMQRERRLALIDQKSSTQKEASGLTSDLRAIYGPSIFSMLPR